MAIEFDTAADRVQEPDLDFSGFNCCGDEDLFPFRCRACGTPMVFCYECDSLYSDLRDLTKTDTAINSFDPLRPIFSCPKCAHEIPYYFMKDQDYSITFADWIAAGLGHLLEFTTPAARTWNAEEWNTY